MFRRSRTSSPARACRKIQSRPEGQAERAMHCPECGFVNVEGANYCQKCGAFLADVGPTHEHEDTTAAWQLGESGDLEAIDPDEVAHADATLVIRAGGGRSGETFLVSGDQMTI